MDFLYAEQTRARLEALSVLEERLTFRLSRLSKLLDNHAAGCLAGSRLNLTSYRILMMLSIFKETSAADLSRLMIIDRAQISRSVTEMIKSDLLVERPDPTNKRRKLLRLTDIGAAELAHVGPKFAARQDVFRAMLSDDEFASLTLAIEKLSRHLATAMDHPEALPASETPKT